MTCEAERAKKAVSLGNQEVQRFPVSALDSFRSKFQESHVRATIKTTSEALRYFSHLWGETVTYGVTEEHHESWEDPVAVASPRNYLIFVREGCRLTNRTIWHELAHLEIFKRHRAGHDLPRTSEEFCDLYALARMPTEYIDVNELAYLGKPTIQRTEWPQVAREVLAYRENNRQYIQEAKDRLGVKS